MDVTPRELRDVEIREAFRGYNRDEVNDLLERAAAAIEALNERARVLSERVATAPAETNRSHETEDMLHRTLLLAQRASDEAIAEAEEKARVMIEEAETRSRRMLADAAIEARRTTESERRRLEQEIAELANRRELLSTDVDGLENFESEYRSRLVSAMEADFHAIERDLQAIRDRAAAIPGDRPAVIDIAEDPVGSGAFGSSAPGSGAVGSSAVGSGRAESGETMEVDMRGFLDDKPRPLIGSGGGVPQTASDSISEAAQAAASEMIGASAPDAGTTVIASEAPASAGPKPAAPPAPTTVSVPDSKSDSTTTSTSTSSSGSAAATIDLFGAEQQAAVENASLDDDSFFASLRDAVRDDAPLGPRDASERAFFDQDSSKDSPSFREAFKRRR